MADRPLRIGYVPEHFSSPLLQLAENDKEIELISCPSGTGQMITALKENTIDVAIALTESLIAGIAKKSAEYKLIGAYVDSPLNWAVIAGKETKYQNIDDLRGSTIGISRIGSGSQVMASVMALQHKWFSDPKVEQVEPLDFAILNDFKHAGWSTSSGWDSDSDSSTFQTLRDATNDGRTSCFMWEWFTTKPFRDAGEVRFIGNVLTPWPSWMLASSTSPTSPPIPPEKLQSFLSRLSKSVNDFSSPASRQKEGVEFIKKTFEYEEKDVRDWFDQVEYPKDCAVVEKDVVLKTLGILATAGVVRTPEGGWNVDDFVNTEVAKLAG